MSDLIITRHFTRSAWPHMNGYIVMVARSADQTIAIEAKPSYLPQGSRVSMENLQLIERTWLNLPTYRYKPES